MYLGMKKIGNTKVLPKWHLAWSGACIIQQDAEKKQSIRKPARGKLDWQVKLAAGSPGVIIVGKQTSNLNSLIRI
jgi:hypothetical protein